MDQELNWMSSIVKCQGNACCGDVAYQISSNS